MWHIDNSNRTEKTDRAEAWAMEYLPQAMGWEAIHRFAYWSPVDFFAVRGKRVVAQAEIKSRDEWRDMVFFNLHKWTALSMVAAGFRVPGYFFYLFGDEPSYEVYGINAAKCAGLPLSYSGQTNFTHSKSDKEPCIEVPVSLMTRLA